MIHTLCLLTASCVSAAEPPGAAANCNCGPATLQQNGVVYYDNGVGKNLRARVRNDGRGVTDEAARGLARRHEPAGQQGLPSPRRLAGRQVPAVGARVIGQAQFHQPPVVATQVR